jgi:hypothetical protein
VYDVAVLGAGAAGCVVAARLAERGARVCLLEAGPVYGLYADGRWPAELVDARALPMSHLWETDDGDRSSSRARVVGGCSAHNARDDVRWNAAFAYLDLVRDRVEVRAQTLVDRLDPPHVLTDRGELEAEAIVVTAGSYGTAAILLHGGLGRELPVGENLVDHPGIGLAGRRRRRFTRTPPRTRRHTVRSSRRTRRWRRPSCTCSPGRTRPSAAISSPSGPAQSTRSATDAGACSATSRSSSPTPR